MTPRQRGLIGLVILAALAGAGYWFSTNPERIARRRAFEREDCRTRSATIVAVTVCLRDRYGWSQADAGQAAMEESLERFKAQLRDMSR